MLLGPPLVGFPSAAIRDLPQFLDIDVDEIAWEGTLVSHRGWFSDGQPGCLINVRKFRHPETGKDAFNR